MMIYWTFGAMQIQAGGDDPAGLAALLGPAEMAVYRGLRFPRRRADWLGARLMLKRLVAALDPRCAGLRLNQIEVLKAESGAPYLCIAGARVDDRQVSLSHSRGYALCLLGLQPDRLGADLEWVEPRDPVFAADYFTAGELAQLEGQTGQARALSETVIWSGKEAALKALATGLRLDTRSVAVTLLDEAAGPDGWSPLGLALPPGENKALRLAWRREGDFALTVCLPAGQASLTRVAG
jgi:phosphopantetheinyl transferase